MNFTKLAIFGATAIATSAIFLTPISGRTVDENAKDNVDTIVQERCDRITNRVDSVVEKYDINKDKHVEKYKNIQNKVQDLVTSLDGKGYDTSEVETNLATLDQMIKKWAVTYTGFISTLKESRELACGDSEGEFKTQIQDALSQLKDFREQGKQIQSFIKNTLRPSVEDLKSQTADTEH